MSERDTDNKLTDELERRLIEREIERDANRSTAGASVFVLEVVVGTLRAFAVFKGAVMVAAVVFVTITLALQAAARFS